MLVAGLPAAAEATAGEGRDGVPVIFVIGAALYLTGIVCDLATAERSAQRWIARHVQLAPSVVSSGAHTTVSLGIGGSF